METNIGKLILGKLILRRRSPRVAKLACTLISVYFEQRHQRHERETETAVS